MSKRDRELLKQARLTQTNIASLLGISNQAVNCGIQRSTRYLTSDRLKKIMNGLGQEKADKLINLLEPEEIEDLFRPIDGSNITYHPPKQLYRMSVRDYRATELVTYFLDKEPNHYEPRYYENAIRQAYEVADAMERIGQETLNANED